MIIITNNENSRIIRGGGRLEELEQFQSICSILKHQVEKVNEHRSSNASAVYSKTDNSMMVRSIDSDKGERTITATFVPNSSIMSKKWVYKDRIIENRQGGTTHLKGWYLG